MRRVDAEAQEHPAALIVGAGGAVVLQLAGYPLLAGEIRALHGSPPFRVVGAADEIIEGNVEIVREGEEDES